MPNVQNAGDTTRPPMSKLALGASGVDAQRAPVRKLHDGGVALPDVKKGHPQWSRLRRGGRIAAR